MGAATSRREPVDEFPRRTPLERTLTGPAVEVLGESLRSLRLENERLKSLVEDAAADLENALDDMEMREVTTKRMAAGAIVAVALGGGVIGAVLARRGQAAAVARLQQEMVDLRRRGAKELANKERFACERLAKDLLPALDAMDALVESASGDGSAAEGTAMTRSVLHAALKSNGVEPLRPAVGEPFDVATMEAMLTVPVKEGAPCGMIETILRPGWALHSGERVIRAAQVGVGAEPDRYNFLI